MGLSQQRKAPWIVDCAFVLSLRPTSSSSIVIVGIITDSYAVLLGHHGFQRPKKPASLQVLNDDLVDKSYIKGYVPSQADVAVFEAVSGPPPADSGCALSWYNYTKSYEKEKASLPGVKKAVDRYGPADVEDPTGSGDRDSKDDDDIDLLGSDEEESEEAKRLREECLVQCEYKKAKKPALKARCGGSCL
uniref:elongation factor 1-beta-like n=1 Tax=Callithrix jacchus TaxID=9483 RepID=UPI0023DD4613|nr:elongation factor 1-beta-like [Callithrix jacchus]